MKSVIGIVMLLAGGTVGIYYGSCYILGGIEGGMPGGGNGHFRDYHDGNQVTEYFQQSSSATTNTGVFTAGEVSENPFMQ